MFNFRHAENLLGRLGWAHQDRLIERVCLRLAFDSGRGSPWEIHMGMPGSCGPLISNSDVTLTCCPGAGSSPCSTSLKPWTLYRRNAMGPAAEGESVVQSGHAQWVGGAGEQDSKVGRSGRNAEQCAGKGQSPGAMDSQHSFVSFAECVRANHQVRQGVEFQCDGDQSWQMPRRAPEKD